MKQRAKYVFVLALAASGIAVSACSDDSSTSAGDGGSGGASGGKTAGASAGGSANKAGSSHSGGDAGSHSGGDAGSTTGGASEAGGNGGAPDGGVGGSDAGAGGNSASAGAGGAGEPALVYACGSDTLIKKQCSALVAANCDIATACLDCVAGATQDRADFQTDPPCDTCNAKWDAFAQCEIDAFESGNLAFGVECVPDYGADGTENCYPSLDEALACEGYVGSNVTPHACPASWPPP